MPRCCGPCTPCRGRNLCRSSLRTAAYDDRALPIACGQTISQPAVVAYMTEQLRLAPGDRVLEVGTGSGYQAAVLAEIVSEVYTIERIAELARDGGGASGPPGPWKCPGADGRRYQGLAGSGPV